jgi:demethylsterigmatocystin 6-O-methyltransferase
MENIIAQIKSLARSTDEDGLRKIQDALREVQYSLETPYDTLLRFTNLVGILHPNLTSI